MLARVPPVLRAAAVSGVSMAVGDVLCQGLRAKAAGQDLRLNWQQTARFGLVGATLHGPFFYHAFKLLDARFPSAPTLQNALLKTAVGQLTVFPVYLSSVFCYLGLLEGLSPAQAAQKVQQTFLPTYKTGWGFWVPANMFNFLVVPPTHRVLYANAAGMVWNVMLSWQNSTKGQMAEPAAGSGGGDKKAK